MLDHARTVGGPALRKLTFHDRARIIKGLGLAILARKEELYELNYLTGATRKDGWIDIEGGAGTLLSFSSKGRRELPDAHVLLDGAVEPLSKSGSFIGQHIYSPMTGAAVHINAFNFPVWGMLEKLAPTLLAGMPAIVKPASSTAYLCEAAVRIMIDTGLLPDGALQLIVGGVGDLFDHLTGQDVVSFTGSASTALKLKSHPTVLRESVKFVAEQDSLNASILGPDAAPGTPEFDLFVKEVVNEMTVKAGQKCTAIRRAIVPAEHLDAVEVHIAQKLEALKVGDPRDKAIAHGRPGLLRPARRRPRPGREARRRGRADRLGQSRSLGRPRRRRLHEPGPAPRRRSVGGERGPRRRGVRPGVDDHALQATSPTPSRSPIAAWAASRCRCSPYDPDAARDFILGAAPFHGRMLVINRDNAADSTGHGSPAPRARPRRPRARRRVGGDGRGARGQALHAAHRAPVDPGDDRRDLEPVHPRRAEEDPRRATRSASG